MSISGHKTRSVFDRYNIVSESDLKQAAMKMHLARQHQPTLLAPKDEEQFGQSLGRVSGKMTENEETGESDPAAIVLPN